MRRYRKPYRIKRKKSIFRNRFFWLSILILIICFGIFYLICFSSTFQIKDVKITGFQKTSQDSLQNIIQQKLEQRLFFRSTKSIFLANLNEIEKSLLERFPQVTEAELKRDFPNTLIVVIKERVPVGVWCKEDDCFLIDKEGIIFEKTQPTSGLIVKTAESEQEITLGNRIIEEEKLKLVLETQKTLKEELKIEIEEFVIVSPIHLKAKTSEGWWINFNPEKDMNWQIVELSLVLENQIPSQRRGELEYINLRFDKIFIFPDFSQ